VLRVLRLLLNGIALIGGKVRTMTDQAPGLRLHARTMPVQRAHAELGMMISKWWGEQDGLTPAELVGILLQETASIHKYVLRAERHPDDPGRKADEA